MCKIKFIIQGLPPSYDHHFKINYNLRQVYLTQEARMFKVKAKMSTPALTFKDTDLFKITIDYYGNFFYKNHKPRKIDAQNLDKLLIDAVSEKLGFDDCRYFSIELHKRQTTKLPFTQVIIEII